MAAGNCRCFETGGLLRRSLFAVAREFQLAGQSIIEFYLSKFRISLFQDTVVQSYTAVNTSVDGADDNNFVIQFQLAKYCRLRSGKVTVHRHRNGHGIDEVDLDLSFIVSHRMDPARDQNSLAVVPGLS